ncbi:MAG: hypothetical protein KME35_03175 [Aphanocapsa sp. GSE-SYN-MK-11-07L]|nr:hypothetical protein [Aphanocapsa sp. GSE-SYN-MK-11-07L]
MPQFIVAQVGQNLLQPLCPIAIGATLLLFCTSVWLAIRDGFTRLQRLHQIPCSHCAYFTGSYHLKCTVHPCKALSEEAIDCRDYQPPDRPGHWRSQTKVLLKRN